MMHGSPFQIFHIYFDTSTYDEVVKDVKVTMEGMLGVVGGTMGLLTGNWYKKNGLTILGK